MTVIKSGLALVVWIGGLMLAGCQVLPTPAKVTLYAIPATEKASPNKLAQHQDQLTRSLKITVPGSSDALAGNRLMVKDRDQGLTAYPGARWESTVPQLWHDYLHQKLLADDRFPVVSTTAEGLVSDWVLMGTLRDFQLETGSDQVVIRYDAMVISSKTRQHIASRTFSVATSVTGDKASAVVKGFGQVADQLSEELLNWMTAIPSK